jgi:hypothetical protein
VSITMWHNLAELIAAAKLVVYLSLNLDHNLRVNHKGINWTNQSTESDVWYIYKSEITVRGNTANHRLSGMSNNIPIKE